MTNTEVDSLLKRIFNKDFEALEVLYKEMRSPMYYYALQLSKSHEIAEDVTQEIFISLMKDNSPFQAKGYGKTWLLTIVKNKTLDALRKQPKTPQYFIDENEMLEQNTDVFNEGIEAREAVRILLSALNEKERNIVVLRVFVGFTLTKIAKDLDLPTGSVFWIYHNAIKKLQKFTERGKEDVSKIQKTVTNNGR